MCSWKYGNKVTKGHSNIFLLNQVLIFEGLRNPELFFNSPSCLWDTTLSGIRRISCCFRYPAQAGSMAPFCQLRLWEAEGINWKWVAVVPCGAHPVPKNIFSSRECNPRAPLSWSQKFWLKAIPCQRVAETILDSPVFSTPCSDFPVETPSHPSPSILRLPEQNSDAWRSLSDEI